MNLESTWAKTHPKKIASFVAYIMNNKKYNFLIDLTLKNCFEFIQKILLLFSYKLV